MPGLRVFLADDHAIVREGLRALINAQPGMEVVGEADNGLEACEKAGDCSADVVVMDLSMPHLNGARATEQLRKKCPLVKVLALTVHEDKSYLRELLEAGASGYVLKRAAADELIRAIQTVAAGGFYLDPNLAGKVVGSFVRKPPLSEPVPTGSINEREEEVLRLVAQGYSNKEIATQLSVSVKTVETDKARSLEKLGLGSRVDLVRYALQRGWLQDA
jgi:DNA-binding NarL/FixJ family response regulator